MRVEYTSPPTVGDFQESNAFVRAIVGPIGSGKSSGCVLEILRRAAEQKPGPDGVRRTRFAVVRNTYRELRDTTRKTFEQWLPSGAGYWREQDFTFVIDRPNLNCEVMFRALDRPQDVKKLLSLELTGCYFNELREIAKPVFDGMQGRVGRYPSAAQGGASWFGVWADSNPWPTGHWCHKLFKREKPNGFELYEQPGGRSADAENIANLPGGYYERLCSGKDSDWVACYVDGQYPSSDVGSVYGELLGKLRARGGVADFDVQRTGIFTSWDLGYSDSTAIWFWRLRDGLPEVVDHYEASGQPLSHYLDALEQRGYAYEKHWLPHDARAKSLQTGASTIEQVAARVGHERVAITPELSVADGIQATRWLLEQPIRIHAGNCEAGLEALTAYRYRWDEVARCYSRTPEHNWASHTADAFRYLACAVRNSDLLTRKPEKPRPVEVRPYRYSFSLDELFESNTPQTGGGRI